ncbi:MAG: hypothetical protein ABJG88_13340 [Litorimonas sp.]
MGLRSTTKVIARGLSIFGHPAIILPAVIIVRTQIGDATSPSMPLIMTVSLTIVGVIILYSLFQVRRGHWEHIDASHKSERMQLNFLLMVVLFGSGFVSAVRGQSLVFTVGLLIVGTMVMVALCLNRWLKVSLHTSFAMFAAFLFWPNGLVVLCGTLLTLAIGWSRLTLERHTFLEILTGILIGACAGLAQFYLVIAL